MAVMVVERGRTNVSREAVELAQAFYAEQDKRHSIPSELVTDDYRIVIGSSEPKDLADHDEYQGAFYTACPDLDQQVIDAIVEGNRVAVRLQVSGTNTGPFMGQPATGKSYTISAMAMIRVEGEKIAEINVLFDESSLLAQLSA
jgi:steroid delta-isomerase-like uncharacterized protein